MAEREPLESLQVVRQMPGQGVVFADGSIAVEGGEQDEAGHFVGEK